MQINGLQLKHKRQQMGFSQQNIADRVGISKGYVCDIENGKKQNLSPTVYKKILDVLEMKEFAHTDSFQLQKIRAELSAELAVPEPTIVKLTNLLHSLPPSSDLLPDLYLLLAKLYFQQMDLKHSQVYAKLAYDRMRNSGNYYFESRCLGLLALIDAKKGSIHSAVERFLLIEGSLSVRPLPSIFSSFVYGMIAILHGQLNRLEKAESYLNKAKEWLMHTLPLISDVQYMNQYLQHVYSCGLELEKNGAFMDAIHLYEECIRFGEWKANFEIRETLQLEMASLHIRNQNISEAKQLLTSIFKELEQCNFLHTYLYLHTLNLMSEVSMIEKDYDRVVKYSDFVLNASFDQNRELSAVALRNKANVQLERDQNTNQYEKLMNEAIAILRNSDHKETKASILGDITLKHKLHQEYLSKRK